VRLEYQGKTFEGNRNEIICRLRQEENLVQREIAELFGVTKSAISLVLIKAGLGGNLVYPELDSKELFLEMSNEAIASEFNIPLYLVKAQRRKFKIKTSRVNIGRRRADLAKFLFGEEYEPGPLFFSGIRILAQTMLTTRRAALIVDFLKGRLDKAPYERVYRSDARAQLKEIVQSFEGRDWKGEGVVTKRDS